MNTENDDAADEETESKTIKGFKGFVWVMLLGITPWLLAVGFGLISYEFFNDDLYDDYPVLIVPMLVIIFSPVVWADKLKAEGGYVFWACVFWLAATGGFIWIRDIILH